MRRSTIVVAVLAATIASASAAPDSRSLNRGTSVHGKSQANVPSTVARSAKTDLTPNVRGAAPVPPKTAAHGASAFTSARNAAAATPAPAAAEAATPARRVGSRQAVRSAQARRVRSEMRRTASVRRAAKRSTTVALTREVPSPRIERPAGTVAAAAPTGSIHGMVTTAAQRAGVSPALAHAVVKVESMYNPRATGKGGYIGLMQLSYQTAKGMGFRGSRQALYEPSANLQYGMRYLAQAVNKAGGSTCGAVSKYQGGHGVRGVTSAGAVYCAKVRRFMASR